MIDNIGAYDFRHPNEGRDFIQQHKRRCKEVEKINREFEEVREILNKWLFLCGEKEI